MKLQELFESKQKILPIDAISMALFKKKSGIVKDSKRGADKIFLGVAHSPSVFKTKDGKSVPLTFDNSTDTGRFEINSLLPLKIEKGEDVDKYIKKLSKKFKTGNLGYIIKGDTSYLREVHFGKVLDNQDVKYVKDLIQIIKSFINGDDLPPLEDEDLEDESSKKEEKKDKEEKDDPKQDKEDPKQDKEEE